MTPERDSDPAQMIPSSGSDQKSFIELSGPVSRSSFTAYRNKRRKLGEAHATVKMLIRQAFDLLDNQISGGPNWLDSENYDIEARVGDGVTIPAGPAGGTLLRNMLYHF